MGKMRIVTLRSPFDTCKTSKQQYQTRRGVGVMVVLGIEYIGLVRSH